MYCVKRVTATAEDAKGVGRARGGMEEGKMTLSDETPTNDKESGGVVVVGTCG